MKSWVALAVVSIGCGSIQAPSEDAGADDDVVDASPGDDAATDAAADAPPDIPDAAYLPTDAGVLTFVVTSAPGGGDGHSHAAEFRCQETPRIVQSIAANGHTHTITLTTAAIDALNQGTSVTLTSSGGVHTHQWTIPAPGPGC